MKKEDRLPLILLGIYFCAMIFLAFYAHGTGDDGDSVTHYLVARYVFHHPENFFYQWAKPVFVLLASPFAQFGFVGVKILNVIITSLAIYFSYRIAKLLRINNAWFVVIALCCMPMYLRLTLSSLTEPLFACSLAVSIFLALKNKLLPAMIIASFLPFMRSEGLIILCIFLFYLISKRKFKIIPWLATGHIAYSIAGYWYYQDFLWPFKTISYATLQNVYGSGSWTQFVYGLSEIIGWPLTILFVAGSAWAFIYFLSAFFKKKSDYSKEELWLIYGSFFSVWIAQMIFWQFGLFKSYGLLRVMIAVLPCAGIICTRGLTVLSDWNPVPISIETKRGLMIAIGVIVIAALYSSLNWKRDFELSGDEKAMAQAGDAYKDQLKGYTFYSSFNYADIVFGFDHFDLTQWRPMDWFYTDKKIPERSVVIWDDFFSNGYQVSFSRLLTDDRLNLLQTFESDNWYGEKDKVAVFVYNGSQRVAWKSVDTIYFNDFEHENFSGIDSSLAFSGDKSVRIDDKNQFSPGLNLKVNQLPFSFPATLQLSGEFLLPKISSQHDESPLLVISLSKNGKPYFWQGMDIRDFISGENEWNKVMFHMNIPGATDSSDVLGVYVWNPHSQPVYVDDLRVERLEKQ